MTDSSPAAALDLDRPWRVRLACCGRDDGEYRAATWDEADAFRESYTSGPGVTPQRWQGGHQRAGIVSAVAVDVDPPETTP